MPLGPPNLASTVLSFSFPVTHRAMGAPTVNADGYAIPSAAVDTTVLAHIHPAPAEVASMLPDGVSLDDTVQGHSTSTLWTLGGGDPPAEPSRLVWDGRVYRLFSLSRWRGGPAGAHSYRVFLAQEWSEAP